MSSGSEPSVPSVASLKPSPSVSTTAESSSPLPVVGFVSPVSIAPSRFASSEPSVAPRSSAADAIGVDNGLAQELIDWLRFELRRGREVRPEAVLCALGALAGYAAQQAIRETMVKTGKLTIDQAFAVIETRSGEVFFFGELLNAVIVAQDDMRNGAHNGAGHASIWKIVSEGGRDAGAIGSISSS